MKTLFGVGCLAGELSSGRTPSAAAGTVANHGYGVRPHGQGPRSSAALTRMPGSIALEQGFTGTTDPSDARTPRER